jgi:hypothetical protein
VRTAVAYATSDGYLRVSTGIYRYLRLRTHVVGALAVEAINRARRRRSRRRRAQPRAVQHRRRPVIGPVWMIDGTGEHDRRTTPTMAGRRAKASATSHSRRRVSESLTYPARGRGRSHHLPTAPATNPTAQHIAASRRGSSAEPRRLRRPAPLKVGPRQHWVPDPVAAFALCPTTSTSGCPAATSIASSSGGARTTVVAPTAPVASMTA